jgi:hypothetical protein
MLTQAQSKGRRIGYHDRQSADGAWMDSHRLPVGSLNYRLITLHAQQMRAAMLAAMLSAGRRNLVHAFKAAVIMIRQAIQGHAVTYQQRR